MKRSILLTAVVPLLCAACYPTRIVTVSPDTGDLHTYSTTVTVPRTHTSTTTTRVVAADNDISLCLDLQAVGAAFAQSSTVEEFEKLLNDSSYMLSNLDLNHDGYVDYLRVVESVEGYNHVFIIQAVVGDNLYQDVATVIAEVPSTTQARVQIVGSSYIYGPDYIVEPVFIATPLIFAHLVVHAYRPWISPWYWNHFPPHYRHPAPIFIGHYHAYVNTYMVHHHFCHEVVYVSTCHYSDYGRVCRAYQRNDYGQRYPERSFTVRNANTPIRTASGAPASEMGGRTTVRNARDLQINREVSGVTRTNSGSSRSAVTSAGSGTTVRRGSSGNTATAAPAQSSTGQTSARSSSSGQGTVRRSSQTAGSPQGQTTVRSRVSNSGTANTRISTVSPSGSKSSTTRSSGATRSSGTARSTSSSQATTRSSVSGGAASSRSASSSARSSSPSGGRGASSSPSSSRTRR